MNLWQGHGVWERKGTWVQPTLIFHHLDQLVTVDPARTSEENPLGVIPNGALAVEKGQIAWVGESAEIALKDYPDDQWVDGRGHILLPGFVDSHTHPVFAGNRADEFELRLQGASYLEIAARGGGIRKTVEATRQASEDELFHLGTERLMTMMRYGVTTVEAKSGYGLDETSEWKSLKVIRRLQESLPLDVVATYMGAHDIPPEYKTDPDAYVDRLCHEEIPKVAASGLAEFCDVFTEKGYFTVEQSRRILESAKAHGMKLKVHAEEFCDYGGATLAGELGAVSADHLLHLSDTGIQAMKQGGTVATLLPGTAFYLRLKDYAPARKILDAGVPVALATDFNPGSCMCNNLQLMMHLACLQMGMLPAEAIRAVTLHGAMAVDRHHDRGSLCVGKRADLGLFRATTYNELLYHFGVNHLRQLYILGSPVLERSVEMKVGDAL
jgi:imidazolonepropionase